MNGDFSIYRPDSNMGVAASWNFLCRSIFNDGSTHALILNDDVYFGRTIDELNVFLNQNIHKDFIGGTSDRSCFIIPKKTFELVGGFDESFYPAYYEDNDYLYRMRLLAMNVMSVPFMNPVKWRKSSTMEKGGISHYDIENCKKYYMEKWGGLPEHEIFKTPFNK